MTTKPMWAQYERPAINMDGLADDLGYLAESMRCEERDSGGARCTMDRAPREPGGPAVTPEAWDRLMAAARLTARHRDERVRVVGGYDWRGRWRYVITCGSDCQVCER